KTAMSKQIKQFYEFGPFRIDPLQRVLLREGKPVMLPPKVFETLFVLVERSGQVVEREKLIETVWPETFVEENNLTQNISALRKTLGDGRDEHRYIETIPRRGYRFAAQVREVWDECADLTIYDQTTVRIAVREETEEIVEPVAASPLARRWGLNRALLAASIMVIVLAGVIYWVAINTTPADTGIGQTPFKGSIAVLPFKALGAGEGNEYLGLGMADTLITKLSNIGQIKVRPTSAVRKYADNEQDSLAAGREQRVDAVLEGSFLRSGDKMRVTVRLLSVRDGSPLWAYKCDEVCTDLFELQDSITEEVAGALMLKLSGRERERLTKRHTESVEAYQAYLKGRFFWNKRTPEDFRKAAEQFQQAIAIDPNYALGYAGLADCYFFSGEGAKTVEALSKAIELDDTLIEAITTQAYYLSVQWDWSEAERLFKRAIELNPNYPPARHWYAFHLAALGRFPEAIEEINRARELDPLSLIINTDVGHILYFSRRYDQAIEAYRRVLEMEPNFSVARWRLGEAYEQKGMYGEAIAEYEKANSYSKNPTIESWLGRAYALAGKREKAREILGESKKIHKRDPRWCYSIAIIYEGLGQKEQAFEWLEKDYDNKGANLALLKVEPMLDSLRTDPRFDELLKRIGLTE
ncbi:MAG TPA: tetratricopeptide repeat protein, partial [Blastocatellia bacterium]|nr:tetratricopeptide repeat protein [Blastocatellia bacterium]